MSIDENVYENLVWVFYSDMDLSTTRQIKIITFVGGVRIEFDEVDLCNILGIQYGGLDFCTTRKELDFSDFLHVDGVCSVTSALCPFSLNFYHFRFAYFIA